MGDRNKFCSQGEGAGGKQAHLTKQFGAEGTGERRHVRRSHQFGQDRTVRFRQIREDIVGGQTGKQYASACGVAAGPQKGISMEWAVCRVMGRSLS